MKIQPAKRLNTFQEYVFSRLAKTVEEVEKESGRKVLSFGTGTPDFPPNSQYIQKLTEYVQEEDAYIYPGYGAIMEFSEGLIHWYKKRFHVDLEKDELFPLHGAKDGISHFPLAFLDEGTEILIPDPGYPVFGDPATMLGAKPVPYNLIEENNFKIDFEELEKLVSEKTKCIWVNFPSNPTGQIATKDDLQKIIDFAIKYNILVLYDNAYSEIAFNDFVPPSILEIEGAKDIAVEIGSYSKTFSFAGFRMGWIVGNKDIIAALAKIKSQFDSGVSIPLQKLGGYVFTHFDDDWYNKMIESYKNRRDTIATYLKGLGLAFSLPKASLYIWAKIPDSFKDSEEFSMKLLREKQILFTPGTALGKNGERYVRVSICVNIDNINKYF